MYCPHLQQVLYLKILNNSPLFKHTMFTMFTDNEHSCSLGENDTLVCAAIWDPTGKWHEYYKHLNIKYNF